MAGQLHDAAVGRERAAQDRQAARRLQRGLDRVDHRLALGLRAVGGDLGDRPAVDRGLAAVEQPVALEQLAHDEAHAARVVHVRCGVAAARPHVGHDRRALGDRREVVDVELDPELVGDREQVEDAVRRAARRCDRGDAVLERLPRDEGRRPCIAPDEVHHQLARPASGLVLGGVLGRNPVQPARRQADELHHRAHRVGGVLAAARAGPGTRHVLDLVQLVERDLARAIRADGLVDRDDRGVPDALVRARVDRAVVEDEARHVEPAEGHRGGRDRLVTADEADDAVEQVAADDELDRVGDHLAADQRRLHPLGAHRDAVAHGDGVELHRRAARRPDALLDELREPPLVVVAGHRLDPRRRHADERLGEVVVGEADRLQHRAGAGAIGPVRQGGGVALGGIARTVVRMRWTRAWNPRSNERDEAQV